MSARGGRFEPRRIVVVVTRQIGDVLLTTPLIAAAKARWPQAEIDVLGFAGTLAVLAGNPAVSSLIAMEPRSGFRRALPLVRRLWRRYDLALVADPGDRAHLFGAIAGRVRSGVVHDRSAWWKRRLLRHVVTMLDASTHVVVERARLLEPWADPASPGAVTPPRGSPLPADIEALLRARPVVVHVPSMWRYKQWPLAHFKTLVAALLADGEQVVVTGGPSAEDRAKVAEVCSLAGPPSLVDVAGRLDLAQLSTLLGRAAVYIGPDTSVTHLAAACGAPTIAIYGPTSPQRWGPWPDTEGTSADAPLPGYALRASRQQLGRVILLQGPGACVPCGRAGCDDHHQSRSDCLDALDPGRVIGEARRILAGSAAALDDFAER
jgi:heptosyltransferase-3